MNASMLPSGDRAGWVTLSGKLVICSQDDDPVGVSRSERSHDRVASTKVPARPATPTATIARDRAGRARGAPD
jgi:hypothetical protein